MYYLLQGKETKKVQTMQEWAEKFERSNRTVKKTHLGDDIEVSTVFLGMDHSFGGVRPLVFETMVFGGLKDGEMDRYSTWDEAEEGHEKMVELVKNT